MGRLISCVFLKTCGTEAIGAYFWAAASGIAGTYVTL